MFKYIKLKIKNTKAIKQLRKHQFYFYRLVLPKSIGTDNLPSYTNPSQWKKKKVRLFSHFKRLWQLQYWKLDKGKARKGGYWLISLLNIDAIILSKILANQSQRSMKE